MNFASRRTLGSGLIALSTIAAIVIQLTTGQLFRSRIVKSEQTASLTFTAVAESRGVNKAIAIPLFLSFVAGAASIFWPRRKFAA
jgi:hypothetical protein